ncbi:short chain dehydrogenase [Enterococcus moraviensis ATCC BAA-383]|uniref:Short chain dehydrogenase n=1 Tax=Enterococcus moraviensis ATCC BAA-383 TaxID=1158609 RepID=R2SSC9_9ENTE|nr:SDR family oxidoreductase [Enterococcus moraviensis]EOH95701.1 short chain dehydrogenase [Enterococcus moraviensis ATCC BAA-383]EOT66188.1 short chain dehydrogenase [Enterococcus moraviensis ATCC BAA-383]OJG67747.1 short chain dehydrogenase [Enterococcus moraviensis]
MEMNIKGKVALVTGSTKGIGKAIAIELAKEGAHVLINGRNEHEVTTFVTELKERFPETSPQAAVGDLVSVNDRHRLFEQFPHVDILINNMGIFQPMAYEDIDDETWETFFRTNVLAANSLVKFYLPNMLKENFGRVLFIASEEAIMPSGEMPQYSMTKTMQLSLAKSLSKLTKGTHVTVNTILPGSTMTEGVRDMLEEMYPDPALSLADKENLFMVNNRPLSQIQRLIDPKEIGRLAAFISSPYASAFSGAAIRMDGGMVPTIF